MNTRPAGSTAPVASAVAATATTARAPAPATTTAAARLPLGGRTAVRAQPAANRHRPAPSGTWASSAVMASPQSRRSPGRVATAAASSQPGPSRVDIRALAWRHQARHSSQAASIAGVPNTAIAIASSSTARKLSGARASVTWRTHR